MEERDKIKTFQEEIGDRIKEKRLELNMTQDDLARKALVSRELVVKWESGQRELKAWAIIQIAEALLTSCDYLLRGIDTPNLDFCERTGLSNRALENLLKVSDESSDTLDRGGYLEDLMNDLLESKSLKAITQAYIGMKWARDRLNEFKINGVKKEERIKWMGEHREFAQALEKTASPDSLPLEEWEGLDETVIDNQEDKTRYSVYRLLETIKKAIEEG